MDYEAHRQTFAAFVALTKVGVFGTIAIVQALSLFGLAAHGFWLGVIQLLLAAVGAVIAGFTKGNVTFLLGVIVIGFVFMALAFG